jgi:hypothetical protein
MNDSDNSDNSDNSDSTNGYGPTSAERHQRAIDNALQRLELQRARVPKVQKQRGRKPDDLHAAFAWAERNARQLASLKNSGEPWAALDYEPDEPTSD